MTSDPIKELSDLLEGSKTAHDQNLPSIISGPRDSLVETDERGWLDVLSESQVVKGAKQLWQTVIREWFDSWLRTVLTGAVIGAVLGFFYRWILLPS